MKDIEKLLQASSGAKPTRSLRSDFTHEVIDHIKLQPRPQGRWQSFKETISMKVIHRPAMAALTALVIIALLSGTAYAAFNWFGTDVQTEVKKDVVTVSNKDCPSRISNSALGDWKPLSDSETTYKILKPNLVTPKDIENSHQVDCERNAIDALSAKFFPDRYDYEAYQESGTMQKDGLYQPFSNYGTVESVNGNEVTVGDIHVNNSPHAADYITATLSTTPETKVVNQGQIIKLTDLKAGDQIYFAFQDKAIPGEPVGKMTLDTPGKDGSVLLLIAKTQYDYRQVDELNRASLEGAIEIIKTNDPNSGG